MSQPAAAPRGQKSQGVVKGWCPIVRYKAICAVFFSLLLLQFVVFAVLAFSADLPANGKWSWIQVLDYENEQAALVGPNCRVWIENYTGNSFRLWKRCGVVNTASGVWLKDLTFQAGGNFPSWAGSECGAKGCTQWSKDGGGSLQTASSGPTPGVQFYSGAQVRIDGSNIFTFGTDATIKNDYQVTCTGKVVAGGVVNQVGVGGGVALQWSSSSYLRDSSAANNTPSASCKAGDTLIRDFGDVASDCTMSLNIVSKQRGRAAVSASCGCVPIKYGIDQVFPGDVCIFRPVIGDPATLGNNNNNVGDVLTSQPGKTFTNADLARMPSGETGIPVSGSDANGGQSETYGFTGASDSVGGAGTNGTPGVAGVQGGTSGGSGGGSGSCDSAGCLDEPTPDSGVIPGVPTYDATVTSPESSDWVQSVRDFISGSPVMGIISGSGVTAVSGACSVSTTIFGATVDFGFCDIPSGVWTTWGVLILAVAHLMAAYIIFR
jgi:hypothetical protein